MKIVEMKNKNNEKVLPDFVTDDLSSNSHVKVPSVYGVNKLVIEDSSSDISLITEKSSNINISGITYKKFGKIISFRFTFHVTANINNGDLIAKINIPASAIEFFQIIRSASSGITGGVNFMAENNKLKLTASGSLEPADWYTLGVTYITI